MTTINWTAEECSFVEQIIQQIRQSLQAGVLPLYGQIHCADGRPGGLFVPVPSYVLSASDWTERVEYQFTWAMIRQVRRCWERGVTPLWGQIHCADRRPAGPLIDAPSPLPYRDPFQEKILWCVLSAMGSITVQDGQDPMDAIEPDVPLRRPAYHPWSHARQADLRTAASETSQIVIEATGNQNAITPFDEEIDFGGNPVGSDDETDEAPPPPLVDTPPPPTLSAPPPPADDEKKRNTPCARDIYTMLYQIGRRMTGSQAIQWMRDHDKPYSDSTVLKTLTIMAKETHELSNASDRWGRGYGLPHWRD